MTDDVSRDQADAETRTGANATTEGSQANPAEQRTELAQAIVEEETPQATDGEAPVSLVPEEAPVQAEDAEQAPPPEEVVVEKPAPGETVEINPEAGVVYVMDFDPNLAQVVIQGQDFLLQFADGSRILFDDLVSLAQRGLSPFLRVAGTTIGGNIILAQAQALSQEAEPGQGLPTLETAAGAGARGGGGSRYDDDTGRIIDLLDAQGPLPPEELHFRVPPPLNLITEEEVPPLTPPTGTLLINPDGDPVPGIVIIPPPGTPEDGGDGGGDEDPLDAFGVGAASSSLGEDIPGVGLLAAQATSGVLTEIRVQELPTTADGWVIDVDALRSAVEAAGGSLDDSDLADGGVLVITFPTSADVTSFQALIGFTPPENSDVDFLGVDVIVTATEPSTGETIQGGTLDIVIPVDAIVDGTEVLVAGQVIPASAFIVADSDVLTTDLQLSLDAFDQTSQAGAVGDADAPFTQGQGDMFDGSEQVTQLVVTLSVADSGLGLPVLDFVLPTGISTSVSSGTASSVTFTVDQGVDFSTVQGLVDSFAVTRPSADSTQDIQVTIQTTTVETDPDGFETNPDNNVDVDDYAFTVTFPGVPTTQFIIDNALGYVPEDTQTGLRIVANIPSGSDSSVVTLIVVSNLPDPATGWQFDISALETYIDSLPGDNSVTLVTNSPGVLTINLDPAAGITSFDQAILVTPTANTDVDILDLAVDATATNTVSGETVDAETFTGDVVVDAVVDGSELEHADELVGAIDTTVDLGLDLHLGGDSTTGGTPGGVPFESQAGTDVDGSELVTLVSVQLDNDAALEWSGSIVPAETSPGSGVTVWSFDTSGLTQDQVEALVASFQVTPTTGFTGTVNALITTTTAEAATVADGGSVAGDLEAFDGDNADVDEYAFVIKFRDGPSGAVTVDPDGDGALSEDTLEDVNISAAVGTVGDELSVIRVTGLPGPSATSQAAFTPTSTWIINFDALQASLPAGASVALTTELDGTQTLTITFPPGSGVTSFDQDISMQAPLDSDVDVAGVQIFVEATDGSLTSDFTGPETSIVVDAIVDGSEVTGTPAAGFTSDAPVPIALNLSLELGNDSTTGVGESQGALPNDFSDTGDTSEQVREITIQLSDDAGLSWEPGFSATPVSLGGGVTEWTFTGLTQAQAEALIASFQVTPAAGFEGVIDVLIETVTVEDNTPEGALPASGQEVNTADNSDTDQYEFQVKVSNGPSGELRVDDNGDGALSEDTLEEVSIVAAAGSPALGDVLTQITVTGLPSPSLDSAPGTTTTEWVIDISALTTFVEGFGGTVALQPAGGTQTLVISFPASAGVTSFDQDILMQAPHDSDVDLDGVVISVTGQNSAGDSATFTGPDSTIVVDAIVDGSEVTGPATQSVEGNDLGPQALNLTLKLGNDSSTGLIPFESQGAEPNDFSNAGDGSESVTIIEVILTPSVDTFGAPGLAWDTGLLDIGSGVTAVPGAGGATTWTFDTSGLSLAQVQSLVASFAADPPPGFDGDIAVDVSTTTVENNTPEGTVPASGQEVNVTDNTDVDDYSFTLSVDTVPVPVNDEFDVNEAPNINLTFVIDRSGSMWDDSPGVSGDPDSGVLVSDIVLPDGIPSNFFDNPQHVVTRGGELHVTRFGLLKIALVELLNAYAETGAEVNVLLVQFASVADVISDGNADSGNWFNNNVGDVIDAIVGLVGAGAGENFTNYTDAVQTARTEFGAGTPSADQNLLYFLSDGAPTTGGNAADNSIPAAELALWESFLADNLMKSIAVGIGEGIAAADDDLEDVAVPNDPFDANPLIVVDESTLISTLVETVPNVVDGNVLANDAFNADGQGTPAITQIVVDGVTYSFDGTSITNETTSAVIAGTVLAVLTSLGGQFEFDFSTGDFEYTAPEVSADQTETFAYTIQDGDGDLASADLLITVKDQTAPPVAVSDSVITNDSTIGIADAWLVFNDSDPQGDTLGVATVTGAAGGSASGGFADVTTDFNFGSGFSIGSFDYEAHDFIQLSNSATVNLSLQAGSTLTGTDSGEILIGGSGADVLNGLGGQDVLVGYAGIDQLDGGAGDDLLVGGAGADQVTGGAGSDVFQITADAPGTGVDSFTDLSLAEDVVDLSQLLGDYESGEDISGFVQVSSTTGTISVDVDGGGDGFAAVATLAGGISAGEVLTVITDADGTQVGVAAV